ncbi:hypothetical protein Q672_07050 [Marinobacter sp. EVN1]|uniref:PstS family phosphate ABC transporter substrate-binding protein n=1 Tax=Marinobacter sp. EVN1 TaxID=1397532 RepID=UPI0003B85CED|nr:substrate-binding domain-containing protein [Marinobacter sp. EVN1]ERS81065.1 hypothetical protein Q672_07050 [Marinobacter sp. EVN1]
MIRRSEFVKSAAMAVAVIAAAPFAHAQQTDIRVSGGWGPYPLMVIWANEYQKSHDNVDITVSGGGTGKGVSDVLNGQSDIGMMGRDPAQKEIDQGLFPIAIIKDSVVGTVNKSNPAYKEIVEQGLSREDLKAIFSGEVTTWGEVIGKDLSDDTIEVYGRSDASGAAKTWFKFFSDESQSHFQNLADANFNGDQPVAAAVAKEPNAIGFNNLNFAFNVETGEYVGDIRPLPLDLNGDNRISDDEAFYQNRDVFLTAVADGRYPSPPARLMYVAGKGPFKGEVKQFVDWILTEGQQYVAENGYVKLPDAALESQRRYLNDGVTADNRQQ